MPMAVWRAGMDKIEAAAGAVDMPLRFGLPPRGDPVSMLVHGVF